MRKKNKKLVLLTVLNSLFFSFSFSQGIMTKLPDTGQQQKYSTVFGEDADYSINPPSYTDNGDGTIKDNVTGLTWQKDDGGEMTWEMSADYCESLSLAGVKWRLPDPYELFGILDHSLVNPALDATYFTKTKAEYWWSNSERFDDDTKAWATNAGGGIGPHPKKETISAGGIKKFHTRCVKNENWTSTLTDNLNGTISDSKTGLMWVKDAGIEKKTWEEALITAETLSFAGYNDWRLPNIKELQSLVDVAFVNPSINTSFFKNTLQVPYWTSTTLVNETSRAWWTDFKYGIVSYSEKTEKLNLRCVRGDISTDLGSSINNTSPLFRTVVENNETLLIYLKTTVGKAMVFKLFNVNGKLIRTINSTQNGSEGNILKENISQLKNGLYILSGMNDHLIYSEKIIVLR